MAQDSDRRLDHAFVVRGAKRWWVIHSLTVCRLYSNSHKCTESQSPTQRTRPEYCFSMKKTHVVYLEPSPAFSALAGYLYLIDIMENMVGGLRPTEGGLGDPLPFSFLGLPNLASQKIMSHPLSTSKDLLLRPRQTKEERLNNTWNSRRARSQLPPPYHLSQWIPFQRTESLIRCIGAVLGASARWILLHKPIVIHQLLQGPEVREVCSTGKEVVTQQSATSITRLRTLHVGKPEGYLPAFDIVALSSIASPKHHFLLGFLDSIPVWGFQVSFCACKEHSIFLGIYAVRLKLIWIEVLGPLFYIPTCKPRSRQPLFCCGSHKKGRRAAGRLEKLEWHNSRHTIRFGWKGVSQQALQMLNCFTCWDE